ARALRCDGLVQVLPGNIVDRSGGPKFLVDVLAGRRRAAAERIDLHFEAEVDSDERRVVVSDRGWIGKADEYAGIVIFPPGQPLQPEHVIHEVDLGVEETEIGSRRRLQTGVDDVETSGIVPAGLILYRRHLPAGGRRAVEQELEACARLWLWTLEKITQTARE